MTEMDITKYINYTLDQDPFYGDQFTEVEQIKQMLDKQWIRLLGNTIQNTKRKKVTSATPPGQHQPFSVGMEKKTRRKESKGMRDKKEKSP
jgi:purine nucleoside phosphorylase